jgi:hypothetical protein
VFDPIFYPGRYPAGKIFLTHGSARAESNLLCWPNPLQPAEEEKPI